MFIFELIDIMFLIKNLNNPSDHFNINDFVSFSNYNTRSFSSFKLKHSSKSSSTSFRHFYFNRLPGQWNSLLPIDINSSYHSIKSSLTKILWSHFDSHFDPHNTCTYHYQCPCSKCVPLPRPSKF